MPPPYPISSMKASCLIRKESQAFLCSVVDTHVSLSPLEDIHIVQEFFDFFLDELPGSLVDQEIEFYIDLNSGTRPIFKAPYHMSPLKLKELKVQLKICWRKDLFVLVFHLGHSSVVCIEEGRKDEIMHRLQRAE